MYSIIEKNMTANKKSSYFQVALLILFIIICCVYIVYNKTYEKFEVYSYGPYQYMDTGSDPLSFYKYPIYRNPYMYPYRFYSSYPYPYMKYYDTNV